MITAYDRKWLDREMAARAIRTGQLAAASGVSRSQIQRIRGGMAPRMDTLASIKAALAAIAADEVISPTAPVVTNCPACKTPAGHPSVQSCGCADCPMHAAVAA